MVMSCLSHAVWQRHPITVFKICHTTLHDGKSLSRIQLEAGYSKNPGESTSVINLQFFLWDPKMHWKSVFEDSLLVQAG